MICMFCYDGLTKVSHPGSDKFEIFLCRACQSPDYYTLHRELYRKGEKIKLYDQIQIDEFILTRYYQPTHPGSKVNYTKIYKESIGILDAVEGATPITKYPPVCTLDKIVDISTNDLGSLKRKFKLWTTFS